MKKILLSVSSIILLIVMLCFCASAETEGGYNYTVTNGKATIISVEDSVAGEITLPSELGGYPVTAIGDEAFYEYSDITGVIVPDSVISIGKSAFASSGIKTISIPDSVTTIGDNAFDSCMLSSINIPASVSNIGKYSTFEVEVC